MIDINNTLIPPKTMSFWIGQMKHFSCPRTDFRYIPVYPSGGGINNGKALQIFLSAMKIIASSMVKFRKSVYYSFMKSIASLLSNSCNFILSIPLAVSTE